MTRTRRCSLAALYAALLIALAPRPLYAQSALDGFDPGANDYIQAIAVQPDGKILIGGDFTTLGGGGTGTTVRNRIGRLHPDGSLDVDFNPDANDIVFALAVQPDGKILVGGVFTTLSGGGTGTTARFLGRLNPDGTIDETFNLVVNGPVFTVILQPDGRILVGGLFSSAGSGGTTPAPRRRLLRLHPDGSLDSTFNPGANDVVWALEVQPDGRILVGGGFTMLGGGGTGTTPRNGLGRLNPDGSLDTTFDPGANGLVYDFAVQPDGMIVVAGAFWMLGGGGTGTSPRNHIGRLHPSGALDTTFNPGTNNPPPALAIQPDGKILVVGDFTRLGGGGIGTTTRNSLGRLHHDGSLDTTFDPGANGLVYAVAVQPDGQILVGGTFTTLGGGGTGTTVRNRIGRLHPDGSLDVDLNPGANDDVWALAVQPDGKILVGGDFTALGGGTGTTPRNRLGRLNPDGTVDTTFNPGLNGPVYALAVQSDGKILVGGFFTTLGGGGTGATTRNRIGRLNPDGSVDTTFNPGANVGVYAIALQPDGKILVGGAFTALGGGTGTTTRNRIGRLNPDGTVDTTFNPGANSFVFAVGVQSDGRILVGGDFTALGGGTGTTTRNRIGRLNPDGTIDTTFNPGANSFVFAVGVQSDGRILVGGGFTGLGGGTGTTTRNSIGRLNQDGTVDTTFNPGANTFIYSIAVQSDGQVLVGGVFTALGGGTGTTPRSRIGRINPDGTVDTTFNPGANDLVFALAVQPEGKILVGGRFTMLGGGGSGATARSFIGQVARTDAAIQRLNVSCSGCVPNLSGAVQAQVTWARGGSGPEAERVTFEVSSNGVTYAPATSATRVSGGWQAPLDLSSNVHGFIRARGYYRTGVYSGSGSIVESIRQVYMACPAIVPTSVAAGTVGMPYTTTFTAPGALGVAAFGVTGALPVGLALSIAGTLSGTPTQAGTFPFTVTATDNSSGCAGSRAFTITIVGSSPVPTLSALSPQSAPSGAPAFTLTVHGSNFVAGAEVRLRPSFGTDRVLPTTFITSTQLEARVVPRDLGGPSTVSVIVFNPAPGGGPSNALPFTVLPPTMALDKTSVRFGAVTNGLVFVSQTAAQIVRLTQTGFGGVAGVAWTATSSQPWLQVSPASGNGSATLSISVVPVAGLPASGAVNASIAFVFTGASNAPGPITVTLNLMANGTSANPFGFVDTPLNNTTGVTGAIPFTGWVLDDVEVTRVMICRAAVAGEVAPVDPNCGGAAQIFVGLGVFIDGARPDVQAAHPSAPLNTRAGWGFMVLTNMLPNQGNGTYQFFMHAEDRDGHTTLLGTRTLTCANASATKPFGAIDTPTQGGPASGAAFLNFGWALTPQPKIIPINGSTMTVLVDGTPLGPVDYNHERPDIETLFPGFQNTAGSNGGVGFRMIDTTTMTNGLHTISWTVTDSLGITEGIGSRFFTVVNGTGAVTAAVEGAASRRVAATAEEIAAAAHDTGPLLGRRGWDLDAPWRWYGVGRAGRAVIRGEEIDRFELALGDHAGARYTGHLRAGEAVAPLPAGSQLDAATGHFTWAPGAGFIGRYDLVFVRWEGGRAVARHEVRVILAPKGSGHVGVQVAIDVPRSHEVVGQPFVLAGWAADLDAATGTGIDTLHVWAYPATGGAPVFLGTPVLGGVRPDVAAVHGDRFREAGFALPLQGLIPGTYDLAVFPWSNVTGAFAPPQIVVVTVR